MKTESRATTDCDEVTTGQAGRTAAGVVWRSRLVPDFPLSTNSSRGSGFRARRSPSRPIVMYRDPVSQYLQLSFLRPPPPAPLSIFLQIQSERVMELIREGAV